MGSRIKELREKRGIIQAILAAELGITQQMLSKYERDITSIKVDVLKRLAEYFCVTTDYILGVSDVKRSLPGELIVNETEYSCAVTPQIRQMGNHLSGNAGTAYASLLA